MGFVQETNEHLVACVIIILVVLRDPYPLKVVLKIEILSWHEGVNLWEQKTINWKKVTF